MSTTRKTLLGLLASLAVVAGTSMPATAQQKPNILVIMGDDIGWSNVGAYHQGLMYETTPNLDQMAKDGMRLTDYYAEASCTAGRANFITGELPIRTGMNLKPLHHDADIVIHLLHSGFFFFSYELGRSGEADTGRAKYAALLHH